MIYQSAQDAINSGRIGGKTLSTFEEAGKLTGLPAATVSGLEGVWSSPSLAADGWSVGVATGLANGKDGLGRDLAAGCLEVLELMLRNRRDSAPSPPA